MVIMDLTYLVVAVLGMCVVPCCSSLPAATATAATDPTPTPSSSQVAADAEPADHHHGKRARSLRFLQSPHPYHDLYDDAINDLPQLYDGAQQSDLRLRTTAAGDENDVVEQDPRAASRARPQKPDSPVYFIRLPPQPYMYVPGYGYVSQPTRLEPPPFTQRPHSPFLNLPLGYVSNGKPVGVYTLPQPNGQNQYQNTFQNQYQNQYQQHQHQHQQQQVRPKPNRRPQLPPATFAPPPPPPQQQPDSPIYNLDKGPYVFNGRPSDVFLLQSAYDNLYSEVLQNIYP